MLHHCPNFLEDDLPSYDNDSIWGQQCFPPPRAFLCEDPDMRMPLIELEGNVRLNVTLILTTNTRSYV